MDFPLPSHFPPDTLCVDSMCSYAVEDIRRVFDVNN